MSADPYLRLCKEHAQERTIARGITYFREGRVRGVQLTASGHLRAVVVGTEGYDVELQYGESGLVADCTCPAWSYEGMCKHAVAFACLADAKGHAAAAIRAFRAGEQLTSLADPAAAGGLTSGRAPSWRMRFAHLEQGALRRQEEIVGREGARSQLFELWIDPRECVTHSGLVLSLTRKQARKGGGYGEASEAKWSTLEKYRTMSKDVRLALYRIAKVGDDKAFGWRWNEQSRIHVPPRDAARALESVQGIVPVYCRGADGDWRGPLTWSTTPWRFELNLRPAGDPADPRAVSLEAELVCGEDRRPLEAAQLLLPGGIAILDDGVGPFDDAGASDWVSNLREDGAMQVRGEDVGAFLESLMSVARGVPLELGELAEPSEAPLGSLDLSLPPGPHAEGTVTFTYGDVLVSAADPSRYLTTREDIPRILRRNDEGEGALLASLTEQGCIRSGPAWAERPYLMPVEDLARRCTRLIEAGWAVRVESRAVKSGGSLAVRVSSGIDWFDIDGEVTFDQEALPLPAILQAVRAGRGFVELAGGGAALLPPEWISRLEALGALSATPVAGENLRVARARAPLLDILLDDLANVQVDADFEALRETLAGFKGVRARRESKSFEGTLRDYQREALGWLAFLREAGLGGCLADDMGLGKTVQVLACLLPRRRAKDRRGPSLVVAPRSVMSNWVREAERFAPALRVASYHGPSRADTLKDVSKLDLIVTTYGTMRRDIKILADIPLDYAVLDESQAIKNATSKTARAARQLDAKHRLALSGTPIENHLEELGSLFAFLNPGLLGTKREFQALLGSTGKPSLERIAWLQAALRPVILRRTREQVLTELPELEEQVLRCALQPEQRQAYDGIREHYRASVLSKVDNSGLGKSKMHVLEALLRLRQAACHPGLIDKQRVSETAAKLELLLPMLEEIADAGHKALVFSQFTSFLAIVRDRLDELSIRYEYLDGKTTKRGESIDRFQEDPDVTTFLISLKAGGTGLNLTAAQYVFILDPWWNPAVEAQAVGRAHRMGQQNPVTVYRLIGEDTVEDRVLQLQARKRELVQAVLGGVNDAPLRGITRADLELLLG